MACDGWGEGCEACGGTGKMEITGCPWRQVGSDTEAAMFAADQARLGVWPLAGGWLDQTQILLEAVQMVWREEARWKRSLGGGE